MEEAGGEGEGFGDGEEVETRVVLGDVGGEFTVGRRGDGVGVEEEGAGGGGCSSGEDVEEGGFSGAAWADDGEDLGRVGGEGDVLENVGWRGGGAIFEEEGWCEG